MTLPHSLDPLAYPARFQWNQPNIPRALAKTACTDTCVQMIIEYWKEKTYTLLEIRHASGKAIDGIHGLTIQEALKALNYFGVYNYRAAIGIDATFALQKAYNGPVLIGVGYNEYPAKKGTWCDQNNTAIMGGKIDCNFKGPHAELVLGNIPVIKNNTIVRYDAIMRDPDHWEVSRPDYDRIKGSQLTNTMNAIKGNMGWINTFAIYPVTKKKL